jgi:hypothetical protein
MRKTRSVTITMKRGVNGRFISGKKVTRKPRKKQLRLKLR